MTKILCLLGFHTFEYEENILTGKRYKVCRDSGMDYFKKYKWYEGTGNQILLSRNFIHQGGIS